jgi:hypothetical protein
MQKCFQEIRCCRTDVRRAPGHRRVGAVAGAQARFYTACVLTDPVGWPEGVSPSGSHRVK